MQASQVGHQRAAHHDVVEVSDHEVSVRHMYVDTQAGYKQSGEPTHGKQPDETECVQHGCGIGYRTFIKRRGPVKDLDGRRNGHEVTQKGKNQAGIYGFAGNKQVMSPNQKSEPRDSYTRKRDHFVSEDALSAERGYQLADYTHAGQHHNINGGVRIEPEEVLVQNGIAAASWIENSDVQRPLADEQDHGDSQHRRAQPLYEG